MGVLKQRWEGARRPVRRGVRKTRREGVAGQQVGTRVSTGGLGLPAASCEWQGETTAGADPGLIQGLLEWTTWGEGQGAKMPRA